MPKRGCGDSRTLGGIYMECEGSPWGKEIEHFIVDPPIHEVDGVPIMKALNLNSRGVQIIDYGGIPHVFDVVGAEHYPDVQNFVEETRYLGASRRCELSADDYARLLPGESRMILVHPRAMLLNYTAYVDALTDEQRDWFNCPKGIHQPEGTMCASLWRADLEPTPEHDQIVEAKDDVILVKRTLPCGKSFSAYYRNRQLDETQHVPAIFLSLPITRFSLVDPKGEHEAKKKKLADAKMHWEVTAE